MHDNTIGTSAQRVGRAAVVGAAVVSAAALTDAVLRGAGATPLWDEETGSAAANATMALLHTAPYLLLAVGLLKAGPEIDAGRRGVGLLRRLLVAALGVLAATFAALAAAHAVGGALPDALGAVFGVSFGLVLLLPFVLGAVLLRRRDLRPAALVLVGLLPVLGLTVALAAVAPDWAHPAYLETAAYVGTALLVTGAMSRRDRAGDGQVGADATVA